MSAATAAPSAISEARAVLREVREAGWPADRDSQYLIGRAYCYLADVLRVHDRMVADEEDEAEIRKAEDEAREAAIAFQRVFRERLRNAEKRAEVIRP